MYSYDDNTNYGKLYAGTTNGIFLSSDLVWEDGSTVEGRLEGRIVDYGEGKTSPDFYAVVKDPKTGKEKEVCKEIKVHKKLDGTAVPEKK